MKVCTDACLFGAWIAERLSGRKNVLDIGTGTGLLSLLYVQKNPASLIDAVEIDPLAAEQAQENFNTSPWNDRLTLYPGSIQEFSADKKYDLILTNPPFFENDLRSPLAARNNAMHDTSLTLEELGYNISRLISPQGIAALLLPYHRIAYAITMMNTVGLQLTSQVLVKQTPANNYFRGILCFSDKTVNKIEEEVIVIKDESNNYTEEFARLLKEYYLYF